MATTIRVSEEFRAFIEAHSRDGETMEETLRRLVGGPDPETLAEIVAGGSEAEERELRAAIERKRERGRERRTALRERFE